MLVTCKTRGAGRVLVAQSRERVDGEIEKQQMSAQEHGRDPRIVAGVDGSASSMGALRWAIGRPGSPARQSMP
jgi:hypothetical protein